MSKVKGVFDYTKKEKKKNKKKKNSEKEEKREKRIIRQSRCNHIAKNTNKSYFKKIYDDNGKYIGRKCLICGDLIIDDPDLLSIKALKDAATQITSASAHIRRQYKMGLSLNDKFTTMIYMVKKLPRLLKELDKDKKKKKKNRNYKKNKRNKKNKKMKRRSY